MPLRLRPPRKGKTPYYSVAGSHLGIPVDRSTKTSERALAKQFLKKVKGEIERGEFVIRGEQTFADAALSYMKDGGERRFMTRLLKHFGDTPVSQINEKAIKEAALALYPLASPATINRQVFTPVSAVLRSAKVRIDLSRPKGAGGEAMTGWLWPEQAWRLFDEARKLNPRFEVLLIVLCFTGMRLSEALGLIWDNVRLHEDHPSAYVPKTKNGEARNVFLPPYAVAALERLDRDGYRVFRFTKGGHIYNLLKAAAFKAGVELPERSKFHIFRHTFATWFRRYGGADKRALLATGAWKDEKSVSRYTHVVVDEEARRALLLPVPSQGEPDAR